MLTTTVPHLRCPRRAPGKDKALCLSPLSLTSKEARPYPAPSDKTQEVREVRTGFLDCLKCRARFPILAGVAILVQDVHDYLLSHVKGIAQAVPDSEIPPEYLSDFLEAKSEIQVEHIEEDLEAERVVALYVMNHYLRVKSPQGQKICQKTWWKPNHEPGSPLIDQLVRDHWDQGPFAKITEWVAALPKKPASILELGCGVGGLALELNPHCQSYLGVDSSFASIALGRHLALGVPYIGKVRIPRDLLHGQTSADPEISIHREDAPPHADFIVGDFESLPVQRQAWALSIALNSIDMLPEPTVLPRLQKECLIPGGIAIQSCPYIWHDSIARKLRKRLPREIQDSARAVEWLYQQEGFKIQKNLDHLPWLFFKHVRQLEIYSVHLFLATV